MNNPVAEFPIVANGGASPGRSRLAARRGEVAAMPADRPSQRVRMLFTRAADGASTPISHDASSSYEALFLSNLPIIDGVIRFVCQRYRLNGTEREEFASEVKFRLVDNDYDVLRRFEQRSSLRTYLTVVIQRMFLDYRNRLWGKWRASAEAQRLGAVAIRLERLIARDGYDLNHACEILRINEGVTIAQSELAAIAARLPVRTRPAIVGEELLETMPLDDASADPTVDSSSARALGARIRRALVPVLNTLADQDRLILRLRFQDGLAVVSIARALNLEHKPLYRRLETLFRTLRSALEAAGIDREVALDVVNRKDVDISLALLGETLVAAAPASDRPPTDVGGEAL
jgi:RNA polymerase sigma factor (sigma-70 family)